MHGSNSVSKRYSSQRRVVAIRETEWDVQVLRAGRESTAFFYNPKRQ